MTRQILLPASVLREMRETFNVGRIVLRRALNYEHNSKRATALRVAALERGGLIYTGERAPRGYCPNVETRYDHVRGMMYQNIGNRVQLQINRETNAASIIIDHEPVATFNDMTIGTWSDVLYSLQKIHNQLNA
ncbi:hypothetical protein [uncultured Rikenella sp.]|uniref:hypothetical protein n=1 Tax=uncultured Rikenella sp. TaxID=368003 RepID=UPI002638D294|nr:hypothetical protein [uncultured Rikenella sp.]